MPAEDRPSLIEFHADPGLLSHLPPPIPAARAIPDWFKQMPMATPLRPDVATVKRCPPFIEAMTAGYIIPLICDIVLEWKQQSDGRYHLEVDIPASPGNADADSILRTHVAGQYDGAPFASLPVLKFMSPWIIKTPPGYSTLVVPPLNRVPAPITPLSGLIETDTHYAEIHFPAVVTFSPPGRVVLPRGMPLVQVIPIERRTWSLALQGWDVTARAAAIEAHAQNRHVYKETHWRKKDWGGADDA